MEIIPRYSLEQLIMLEHHLQTGGAMGWKRLGDGGESRVSCRL